MPAQLKLHSLGVLAVVQSAVYDISRRMVDYLEPSPTKVASVAKCIGLDLKIDDGVIYIGNPSRDVHAFLDGREYDRGDLDREFKAIVAKVRTGETEADVPLDISLRRLDNGCIGVSSASMHCDFPVRAERLTTELSSLCREWADMNLAEGDARIIRIVRDITDPDSVLVPQVCAQCPHGQTEATKAIKKPGMAI